MQKKTIQIPFNIPHSSEHIIKRVCARIQNAPFDTTDLVKQLEDKMRLNLKLSRVKKMYFVHSATHALEIMALALELKPGDEVIVPAYTYVATANAFAKFGAKIRFADIDPDTLNISVNSVQSLINPLTRAIVPIHYAGYPADLIGLKALCEEHHIVLFEDAAHAIGVNVQVDEDEVALGSFGEMGCISFHATKNITSGGSGGVLFVNEGRWISKVDEIYHEGTNRSAFLSELVSAYTWTALGGDFQMSPYHMASLYETISDIVSVNQRRQEIAERYHRDLSELDLSSYGVCLPMFYSPNGHIYYLLFSDVSLRERFIVFMKENGIAVHKHYEPLHVSALSLKNGFYEQALPITEKLAANLIRLPIYSSMTDDEQSYVIESLKYFFEVDL